MVASAISRDAPQSAGTRGVPSFDIALVLAASMLILVGLIMLASASIGMADRALGEPLYYFWRQTAFVVMGLVAGWLCTRVEFRVWVSASVWLCALGILLLLLVLVPGIGREVNGSMRWISVGGANLQPSELMKLSLVLYIAGYLVRRGEEVRSVWTGVFRPLVLLALVASLLLAEPDYGASVVMGCVVLGMLFLGGAPLRLFLGGVALVATFFVAVIVAAPYRLQRVATFLHPWDDPFGTGFQLTQALIAIGRGEWFGVGLGASVQKLFYLPEAHTDFLFAVLAEELGFLGVALVVCTFAFILWRAFSIARRAELRGQYFGAYTAYGLGLLLGVQAFINMGVNLGVLPTKGLTLPLVSYGGSSIIISCVAVGMLLRIDYESRWIR
jgi:cell division protein FtsW